MAELDDAGLEVRLRRALGEQLDALPFELTAAGLEARRQARERGRASRRRWIVLGLAAMLILPAGWLAAGAPLPRPTLPSVALQTLPVVPPSGPEPSVTRQALGNGTIAYSVADVTVGTLGHLHVMNADGTGDHEITRGYCPRFSIDGSSLAYRSGSAETRHLVVANADSSSPRVLPDFGGSETLSPDFSQVAWIKALNPNDSPPLPATRDRSNELWVTLVSGGTGVRVAPKSATSNEHYIDPVWSPDGRRIAFAGVTEVAALPTSYEYRSAIYVVDADGSDLRLITARPGVGGTGSWSPDGRYLVYPGSPDGTALPAFSNGADVYAGLNPPADIFVIGSDGAGDRNLTNTPWDESGAEWSPDGSRLAYGGARVEGGLLSRVATLEMAEGAPVGPPTLGPATNTFLWSPDGTRLLLIHGLELGFVDSKFEEAPTWRWVGSIGCGAWQRLQR